MSKVNTVTNVNYILENGIKILKGIPLIEISRLKRHPNNIKKHPEEQIKNLMELMKIVGFKDPIVIDKKEEVKAGHGRLDAAELLGMKRVPYVPLEGLTKKQMDLFMYMDNYVNESPWIDDNVQLLLENISLPDLNTFEVNWDDIITLEPKEETEIPEPPDSPKSKLGDIYQLGNHRVMCGDCTKDIDKLLEKKTVDLLLTDHPYGVDYSGKNKFLNTIDKGNRIQEDILNDNIKDYREFFGNFLKNIPFSEYNSFYINISGLKLLELSLALQDNDYKISQHIVWVKNNHVLGRQDYANKHEFLIYGWNGRHKWYGEFQTTVWEIDKPLKSELHPTMKPIELIVKPLMNSTKSGMLVFDPFLGSGSTLIACEQTNRICYGMELDPSYVDVIIQRFENYTGKRSKLLT